MSTPPSVLLLLASMVVFAPACGTDASSNTRNGDETAPSVPSTAHSAHTSTGEPPIREPMVPPAPPLTPPAASAADSAPDLDTKTSGGNSTSSAATTDTYSAASESVTSDTGIDDTSIDDTSIDDTSIDDTSSGASSSETTASTATRSDTTRHQTTDVPGPSDETVSDSATSADETSGCPHAGSIEYRFNGAASWPAEVTQLLTAAMDEALYYYNCYSNLSHQLTVNYDGSVPTAQANVDGWITFGSNRSYMVVATAMHEVAHTLGVGFYPWNELLREGRWVGAAVNELMASIPSDERDPDYGLRDYITADAQHFWPYGLNYASEHLSEWSLINHVRIVAAMRHDKENYLSSR